MSENLRQRRGKNTKGGAETKDEKVSSDPEVDKPTPMEQLKLAQARLIISRDRTADLHALWRSQIFRMSLIVLVVSLHQFQSPIQSCIVDIKAWNEGTSSVSGGAEKRLISGRQTIGILFSYTYFELLAIATAFLLAYFLATGKNTSLDLTSWPYVVTSALVPLQLGIYFHSKQESSCISGTTNDVARNFPVVVIYHTVVTVAVWFMKSGIEQCNENVALVTDSIKDFERIEKKLNQRRELKCLTKK